MQTCWLILSHYSIVKLLTQWKWTIFLNNLYVFYAFFLKCTNPSTICCAFFICISLFFRLFRHFLYLEIFYFSDCLYFFNKFSLSPCFQWFCRICLHSFLTSANFLLTLSFSNTKICTSIKTFESKTQEGVYDYE